MGKGFVFIVVFAIFTLILFIVLCFLMGRINPPPIVVPELIVDEVDKPVHPIPPDGTKNLKSRRDDLADLYNDEFEDKTFPGLQKTVPKTNETTVSTVNHLKKPVSTTVKKNRKIPTTLKHGSRIEVRAVGNYVNDTIGTASSEGHQRQGGTADYNNIERNIYIPISGTLILKILDYDGDTRVEIKLNPIPIKKKLLNTKNINGSLLDIQNDFYNKIIYKESTDFGNRTEIIIMPNNTVVYDDNSSNILDNINFTDYKTDLQFNSNNVTDDSALKYLNNTTDKIWATTNNVTVKYYKDMTKKSHHTTPKLNTTQSSTNYTDMLPLKVVFNNETKLFTNSYKVTTSETVIYRESVGVSKNSTKSGH